MNEVLSFLSDWGGIILLLILAVIGIILSLAGAFSAEERAVNGQDAEHYVLRQPLGRVVKPLIVLVVGIVAEFVLNLVQRWLPEGINGWIVVLIKVAVAVVFGLVFWRGLANVVRRRVFVNGNTLIVTPASGKPIETTFSQIRTVANKMAGGGGVVGKKIRTKEGKRFEVLNSMSGYEQFCVQLDTKVELPNLTRRLFKGKDKKAVAEETWDKEPGLEPPVMTEAPWPEGVPVDADIPHPPENKE